MNAAREAGSEEKMRIDDVQKLKQQISKAGVVSFDVFDTLLFRKVDTPETIFDIIGKCFGIYGFRKLRIDCQNEASRRAYALHQYPHADFNEIYEVLSEHTEIPVDWQAVKEFEIQLEKDALVCNPEMWEMYCFAKSQGKRVIAVTDMYLLADTLSEILINAGYTALDHVYCSADEHKAKFNKELFPYVKEQENVPFEAILHIGDSQNADVDIPQEFGICTFHYQRQYPLENLKAPSSGLDMGLTKILYNPEKSFWYNLGIQAGGPLYMGLYQWVKTYCLSANRDVFFLSRDGYNLWQLLNRAGYANAKYLYMSRRSMLMAGITELDSESLRELPPYTFGQTVGEILDYLGLPRKRIKHLKKAGFSYFSDVIRTMDDINKMRSLYALNSDVVLAQCEKERFAAVDYLKVSGFLKREAIVFDCGWNGSSQYLLERFKKAIGYTAHTDFLYFGIRNTEKSRRQLHGLHYDTYAFDFYKNYSLMRAVEEGIAVFEIFFSAPHESVFGYGADGPVLEPGPGKPEQHDLLEGIQAYLDTALPFLEKYAKGIEYSPDVAIGHLQRLAAYPTAEEAVQIGNLANVDGFARQKGVEKKIAFFTEKQFMANPHTEVYWLKGFLKRPDVPDSLKTAIAKREGQVYPLPEEPAYHLEAEASIRNYQRWRCSQQLHKQEPEELTYRPKFSVVIPVYNTLPSQLREAFDSVLAQTYENYELILVDDASTWESVVPVLKEYESNPRVHILYRQRNGHISEATNDAIAVSDGEYIVFMDCDDTIESTALYEFASLLNRNPELDFIYSDEDKLTEDGLIRHMPFFKPDWSPDLFMDVMYTNHLAAYRSSITKEIGGLRSAFNGSQDYDFTLRFMEKSDNARVGHIPKILYHWRERRESVAFAISSKNYASEAGRYAKESAFVRRGLQAHLEYIPEMAQYRTVYDVEEEPLVSIVIPSKDHLSLLRQCLDSIETFTTYRNYEIIVVDNGSSSANQQEIASLLSEKKASYLHDVYEFNFSQMCNLGADCAKGEYLLFLNDDIEVFQPDWLTRLVGQAMQPHTGAVGAKLFYPESTEIQHGGVFNHHDGPRHMFFQQDDSWASYFGLNRLDLDCIAVTGACLLLKRSLFVRLGGFDETLPVAYNDVDLCFRIYEAGYYNVIRNDVCAYHHESASRGIDNLDSKKVFRLSAERQILFLNHPSLYRRDPFLNENLEAYAAILLPKERFDKVSLATLRKKEEEILYLVDYVSVTDTITIFGWSFLPGRTDNYELTVNILLADPNGVLYRVQTQRMMRPDVNRVFGREDLLYSGFESVISRKVLRAELVEYRIGVEIIDHDGRSIIGWSDKESPLTDVTRPLVSYADPDPLMEFCAAPSSGEIKWNIDSVSENAESISLVGWTLPAGNRHYLYNTQVILAGEAGHTVAFPTYDEDRPDVAIAFPEIRFLRYAGFRCDILKQILHQNETYHVILRITNRLDPPQHFDVLTKECIRC